MDMMHPAVKDYMDNKAQYDADYFIKFVSFLANRNPNLAKLIETDEYKAFIAIQKVENPFKSIMDAIHELGPKDLTLLIDNMPSGWQRSQLMDKYDDLIEYAENE